MVLFDGSATGEHVGSPLRILTIVQRVSARLVVAPYGDKWQCSQQFGKFLFDLLRVGHGFLVLLFYSAVPTIVRYT